MTSSVSRSWAWTMGQRVLQPGGSKMTLCVKDVQAQWLIYTMAPGDARARSEAKPLGGNATPLR